jgi:hypothetical protein
VSRCVIGGDPLVAHRSEVRGTPAARGRHFRDYNRGYDKANRDAERKEKHRYFPFYSERVSEAVAVIGRTLRDLHRSNRTRLERRWRRDPSVTLVSSAAGVGRELQERTSSISGFGEYHYFSGSSTARI